MTDQDLILELATRPIGKESRRTVEGDQVRGVVYGKSMDSTPVIADYNTLYRVFSQAGGNQIVEMKFNGESHDVLFKDVDYHPVTNRIRHFDMYAVTKGEKITVEVPIVMVGDAPAVRSGYNVITLMESVEVSTVPRKLPEEITVSAETLVNIGDTITIADIDLDDKDIEVFAQAEDAIAKVEEIQEMKVEDDGPTEMPDAEGEEGEEGAEASSDAEAPKSE